MNNMFKEIEEKEVPEDIIKNNDFVIFQFGTENCAPCKSIFHKLDIWSRNHENVVMRYIPIEKYTELSAQMGVLSSPAVLSFTYGKLFISKSGYFSLDEILHRMETIIGNGNED